MILFILPVIRSILTIDDVRAFIPKVTSNPKTLLFIFSTIYIKTWENRCIFNFGQSPADMVIPEQRFVILSFLK